MISDTLNATPKHLLCQRLHLLLQLTVFFDEARKYTNIFPFSRFWFHPDRCLYLKPYLADIVVIISIA